MGVSRTARLISRTISRKGISLHGHNTQTSTHTHMGIHSCASNTNRCRKSPLQSLLQTHTNYCFIQDSEEEVKTARTVAPWSGREFSTFSFELNWERREEGQCGASINLLSAFTSQQPPLTGPLHPHSFQTLSTGRVTSTFLRFSIFSVSWIPLMSPVA